jgi:hypothetical protein
MFGWSYFFEASHVKKLPTTDDAALSASSACSCFNFRSSGRRCTRAGKALILPASSSFRRPRKVHHGAPSTTWPSSARPDLSSSPQSHLTHTLDSCIHLLPSICLDCTHPYSTSLTNRQILLLLKPLGSLGLHTPEPHTRPSSLHHLPFF